MGTLKMDGIVDATATAAQTIEANEQRKKDEAAAAAGTTQKKVRYSGLIAGELWQAFTAINTKISVPNNSVINMLIARYVEEKKAGVL